MRSVNSKMKIMEDEEVGKAIWKFAVPGIIACLISAVYNIVDTAFIGMLDSTVAIAAASVVFPFLLLVNSVGQMIGIGASSYISRLLGAKKKENAEEVAATAIVLSIVVGIIISILTTVFLESILRLLGTTEAMMPYAKAYAKPIAVAAIFPIVLPTLANIIRSEGNTKQAAIVVALGGIINAGLDPIFMFVLDLGIFGAALATVTSQLISIIIFSVYYFRKKGYLNVKLGKCRMSKMTLREIISIGIASFLVQALISLSMGILNVISKPYGEELIAAFGISLKVSAIIYFIIIGYNQGFQPIASYNYGAKNYEKLRLAIKISIKRMTIFATIATLILIIFAKQAIGIFTDDPRVIEMGVITLRTGIIMFPALGFIQLYSALYQSVGMPKQALIVGTARQGIFFIPLIFILANMFGMAGVIITQGLADLCTLILVTVLAKKTNNYLKIQYKSVSNM